MVAANRGRIWYSDDFDGRIGRLDPELVVSNTYVVTPSVTTLSPDCVTPILGSNDTVPIQVGATTWSSVIYTSTLNADGWQISVLPVDSYPWGITTFPGQVWFVDNGRQVLSHFLEKPEVEACKLDDADGDLNTIDDQSPIPGWTVYLLTDGVRQEPGKLTGADGCVNWYDLDAGTNYGVEEDVLDEWQALTPTSHDFGTSQMGEIYEYTFVNALITSDGMVYLPILIR
jgi:hypothetical protein